MSDDLAELKQAVRMIRRDQWTEAHERVQSRRDELACWIHAWLHRQEGDEQNARYWYGQAGRHFPESTLDEELEQIAHALDEPAGSP